MLVKLFNSLENPFLACHIYEYYSVYKPPLIVATHLNIMDIA